MIVKVLLFAAAKEIAEANALSLEVEEPCTLQQLKASLIVESPKLAELAKRSAFSVNHAYAHEQTVIGADAEVAMIPPVSGG